MASKLTEPELQQLASHLRCPSGDEGLKVAELMNVSNAVIISKTISSLNIKKSGEKILEIGPGNAEHIKALLPSLPGVLYHGIDISETMIVDAKLRCNNVKNASFYLTDGESIPAESESFTKAFTVNTIYFWKNAKAYANEIARTLVPEGLFSIGFIPKHIMEKIPFAKYGFTLYDEASVKAVLEAAGFEILSEITERETITGTSGEQIERDFVIITAKKQ